MFNYAVFRKTVVDSFASVSISGIGLIGFAILFVWAMLNMGTQVLEFVSQFPFIRKIFEMAFGINVEGNVSISVLLAVCFTHGVVLAITWGILIAATTRYTAGEIEKGTADMLLSLPLTRTEVYISTSLVWILAAVILSSCPVLGIAIATRIFEMSEEVQVVSYIAPAVNFFCLNLAVGGIGAMIAGILNRRGIAVGATVGVLLTSMVLTFLEPFIEPVKSVKFLSLLNYFRPVDVVRTGEWPWAHIILLVAVGGVTWSVGLMIFSRKDIPTA